MSLKADILARLSGQAGAGVLYLPDLTLWYDYHHNRGSLPAAWQDYTLPDIARALSAPIWATVKPWRIETPGITITRTEEAGERLIRSETPAGVLTARWKIGPNGEWWQTEYPVKTEADLEAVLALVEARAYLLEPAELEQRQAGVGEDGILALEIPRRPYSDLIHEFLGWSEGLFFLGEPAVEQILATLEEKLQAFVPELAQLPVPVILSPDNLDGQYISPAIFKNHLADSYRLTTAALHRQGQFLVVHVGGFVKRILPDLAAAGVDAVEGLAGPPHADLTLAEARQLVGPGLTLWGGIPQDFLLEMHEPEKLAEAVAQAVRAARHDPRMIIGVADRVPVDADLERLRRLAEMVRAAQD